MIVYFLIINKFLLVNLWLYTLTSSVQQGYSPSYLNQEFLDIYSLANMITYLNRAADDLLYYTYIDFNYLKIDLVRSTGNVHTWQLVYDVSVDV